MGVLRFNRPVINVSNMEQSLDFYCGKLGMVVVSDNRMSDPVRAPFKTMVEEAIGVPDLDVRFVFIEAPGGGNRLGVGREMELIHWAKPEWKSAPQHPNPPVVGVPMVWPAFVVDNLQALYDDLMSQGVKFRGNLCKLPDGRGLAYAIDPNGYTVELSGTL